jgi:hypothetical protein
VIQYSRGVRVKTISRGVLDRPVKPGDDSEFVAAALNIVIARSKATKQSMSPLAARWIASLCSQ